MTARIGVPTVTADLQQLCRGAVSGLPVAGAALHLLPGSVPTDVVAASSPAWHRIGELVGVLEDAPCLEAARTLRPVLVDDLHRDRHRWPAYAHALAGRDVGAVFSFPLRVGAVRLGVLDLYAGAPGPLRAPDLALAEAFAQVATATLLLGARWPGSRLDARTRLGADVPEAAVAPLVPLPRPAIPQAQGMVMVLLEVDLDDALALLRARAFALGRPLADLAQDIVDGAVDPRSWDDDAR
jgi:hypothetical protein